LFEIVYMKADFEPWWMFEDWEETIIFRKSFEEEAEAKKFLAGQLAELLEKTEQATQKNDCYFAFWSKNEKRFCESCDEDLQIFHGIISFIDGSPAPLSNI
jgi:hypothetical protein